MPGCDWTNSGRHCEYCLQDALCFANNRGRGLSVAHVASTGSETKLNQTGYHYQPERPATAQMRESDDFDMLGENLGHDRGRRHVTKHDMVVDARWSWKPLRRGNSIACTIRGPSNRSPRSTG